MSRRSHIEAALARLAPRIPRHESVVVADHAMDSPGLKSTAPERAVWLSLVAYVRHRFTEYDALLADGYDPESARFFVLDEMNAVLASWGVRRRVSAEE